MQFHERLSELMDARGYTNYRLSQLLDTSQSTIAYWVDGRGLPQRSKRKQLADLFGVSIAYLMGEEEATKNPATGFGDGDEIIDILQTLRDRPEMRLLFDAGKKATPETVRKTARLLEEFARDDDSD